MNNDLISRSELKETIETWDKFACLPNGILEPFRNLEHPEMFEPYIHFRDVIKAIDNAPTIPLPDFKEGYKQAIRDGKTNFSRPKGEWIIVKDERYGDNVKCPFCGKELAGTDLNFCCKCGAELIGSEKMNMEADNEC